MILTDEIREAITVYGDACDSRTSLSGLMRVQLESAITRAIDAAHTTSRRWREADAALTTAIESELARLRAALVRAANAMEFAASLVNANAIQGLPNELRVNAADARREADR